MLLTLIYRSPSNFNYPNLDWSHRTVNTGSASETLFMSTIQDHFLEQVVLEPTRYRTGQSSHILDLVLTNNVYFIEEICYHNPLGASDHLSLLVGLKC